MGVDDVGAYPVPWLDNALDTIATPAAMLAVGLLLLFVAWWLRRRRGRRSAAAST